MTGEGSDDGLMLLRKESGPDAAKKKKKSQREDGIEKESSHKKKSSLSKVDGIDKTLVHKRNAKETKSADMDKSAHHKKKKNDDEVTPIELEKSTHKKKKKHEEESVDKASNHKHKDKAKDDLDKGSKHPHRHSKTESSQMLDKASSHRKKSKEFESLDKSSRDKKTTKDMDKSSHKKHKSKSNSSLDESSTQDAVDDPSSSVSNEPVALSPVAEKDEKDGLPATSTHKRGKKSEKEGKDALAATSTHKRGKKSEKEGKGALAATLTHKRGNKTEKEGKDALATSSTHKRGKKSENDGKDELGANSTHKGGKKSEKDGKDALGTDSKHKRGKKSEKDGKDALGAGSTHRRGKKSDVLQAIKEESTVTEPSPGEHLDHHRRGKKKDVLRETVAGNDDSNDTNDDVVASKRTGKVDDKAGSNCEITMDTTTGARKVRLSTIDDASDTSDDDSSMGSFGEEGNDYCPPPQRIAGSDAQLNRQGTRGPAGVFLSRQSSKNLGRILSIQASEDDIFAALEAEAENLKDELSNPKLVTRGLTRSKSSSNSHRSSSFDKKQKSTISGQSESILAPKWQPGQEIKPMAAEDLRAMLNIKSPPKRTPTWRDSRWFRDDVVPTMPLTLAVNALPPTTESTFEPGKLVTLPNGTVKMLRGDQCEGMKVHSALRKSQVKDALRQSLNATIH